MIYESTIIAEHRLQKTIDFCTQNRVVSEHSIVGFKKILKTNLVEERILEKPLKIWSVAMIEDAETIPYINYTPSIIDFN